MERLTAKLDGKGVFMLPSGVEHDWCISSRKVGDVVIQYLSGAAADRLAAYEDTELEPSEIQEVVDLLKDCAFPCDVPTELMRWAERCTWHVRKCAELNRALRRYEEAERDGRLVVLPPPAKEGDQRPECFYNEGNDSCNWCLGMAKSNNDDEPTERCKACWYCESAHS